MEVGRNDALECRDRCLAAVITADNFDTARALWCAAKRYNKRDARERTAGLECSHPLPPRSPKGEAGARLQM